ncbi:peptidase family C78-domain-containing protein [Aspergillus undulatus]|uniref:peptidase family C78-domain-containing protein n=1 Tax=Aspergillus undulatus TaxID=1810928 RepID=UPI003CCCBF64
MNAQSAGDSTCPFCPFFDPDSDFVAQHLQYCHPEHETQAHPGVPTQIAARTDHPEDSVQSGHTSLTQSHIRNHNVTKARSPPSDDRAKPHLQMSLKKPLNGNTKRLGRAELGPYAHEKKMPSWLLRMLDQGNAMTKLTRVTPDGRLSRHVVIENQTPNVVPALAQLCGQDKSVQRAFLCSAHVHHISKMPREGGFCGYRNIQMLVSYIQQSRSPGSERFTGALPTILRLQDMIEHAWDEGYNSIGRTETGGIRGTRKYIGTSESKEMPAHSSLLSHIAASFKSACPLDETEKVVLTNLPPIYFQHRGHSMTIVGFEIREQGKANLLVFDPTFKTPSVIKHAATPRIKVADPTRILKGYRKGVDYLQNYHTFELLKYAPHLMRKSPNIIITGTPGVGKTVHCEQLAQDTGLRHLSINQVAKDRGCYDTYDEELKSWVVDEDKLLDAIEDELLQGGYLIDWHACDLFPKSWIDLVVVVRCPSTSTLYDRLSSRGYHEVKLQENLDAEIFGVLLEEAREAFDEEIVVELNSEEDGDVDSNCSRISSWVENWKSDQARNSD